MYLESPNHPYVALRSAVVANDTALAAFNYADWPSSYFDLKQFHGCNMASILFWGKDAEDEDFSYILYGRRKMNGPVLTLQTGTAILGSQLIVKNPISKATVTGYWADTIALTAGLLHGVATVRDSTTNRVAELRFPINGLTDLYLELAVDGGSVTCKEINAIITGFRGT